MNKIINLVKIGLAIINKVLPDPPKPIIEIELPELSYTADNNLNLSKLVSDAVYKLGSFSHLIKAGFEWDGASIPKWAWIIVGSPFEPRFMVASAIHDDMYRQCMNRANADLYFYWILLKSNVDQKVAEKMYYAVRIGGYKPYNKYLKLKKGTTND